MAKSKKNEILEEQRHSREEFLRLKKMQSGEINAGPKPSEVAIVPKTFKEKSANFWFQYKWRVLGIAAVVIVFIICIVQCASRPKYDFSVVYFTYTSALDDQTELISDYFQKYAEDLNGDGEVNIQVLNCSFNNDGQNNQYRTVQLQKLQAYLAGEYTAMLYITDEESVAYFNDITDGEGIFENEPVKLSGEFYKMTKLEGLGELPKGLTVGCRKVNGTVLEDNKTAEQTQKEALRILKIISNS